MFLLQMTMHKVAERQRYAVRARSFNDSNRSRPTGRNVRRPAWRFCLVCRRLEESPQSYVLNVGPGEVPPSTGKRGAWPAEMAQGTRIPLVGSLA